jgi:hypothetical protein
MPHKEPKIGVIIGCFTSHHSVGVIGMMKMPRAFELEIIDHVTLGAALPALQTRHAQAIGKVKVTVA